MIPSCRQNGMDRIGLPHWMPVAADMAIRLEKAGWSEAETWLGVQSAHDLWHARQRAGAIDVKPYPVPDEPPTT